MATSGTTAFDLQIDDIIEEAYERCGMRTNSGNDIRSARRSLNLTIEDVMWRKGLVPHAPNKHTRLS